MIFSKKEGGIRREPLIDWNKRDEEYLQLVKKQVEYIKRTKENLERITVGLVGRKTKNTLLQKHLDRMPKTI